MTDVEPARLFSANQAHDGRWSELFSGLGSWTVSQTAFFEPRGLVGLRYGYAVVPFHVVVFRTLLAGIQRDAMELAAQPTATLHLYCLGQPGRVIAVTIRGQPENRVMPIHDPARAPLQGLRCGDAAAVTELATTFGSRIEQIGQALGLTAQAVTSRLHRGRAILRPRLAEFRGGLSMHRHSRGRGPALAVVGDRA